MSTDSKMTREQVLSLLDVLIKRIPQSDYLPKARAAVSDLYDTTETLRAEVSALRSFVQALFDEMDWPEGGDLDAFAFQNLATKHGLLLETEVNERCGEFCQCADLDEPPFTCYRKTPLLTGERP